MTLYVYVKKGSAFAPGAIGHEHVGAVHWVSEDAMNGDALYAIEQRSIQARALIAAACPSAVVAPPLHRTLDAAQVATFAYCAAAQGDTTYDLAEKLYAHHKMPWLHPEYEF